MQARFRFCENEVIIPFTVQLSFSSLPCCTLSIMRIQPSESWLRRTNRTPRGQRRHQHSATAAHYERKLLRLIMRSRSRSVPDCSKLIQPKRVRATRSLARRGIQERSNERCRPYVHHIASREREREKYILYRLVEWLPPRSDSIERD